VGWGGEGKGKMVKWLIGPQIKAFWGLRCAPRGGGIQFAIWDFVIEILHFVPRTKSRII